MNTSRRSATRLLAWGSAAGVIGVPIALMARTWTPLETPRRDTGSTPGEPGSDPDAQPGNRGRNADRRREPKAKTSRRGGAASDSATPEP
jgi:hypothetical protein